ncbi:MULTISPECIES: glycosyl hydrolase family 28-related protein [unclassified Pseudomonas]|uniref:glycosyl hydrolase family 28-related protein n=1 Tax=unclassified Pseudomonas TaxID=196821 RepID=UPI000C884772|nr:MULTISPECIES: glycosyl hydrolase family 28-related protein [unclassified Pseudomonas]PMZ68617.1 hypothetical protein C1X25_22115 [Pseudomonas sp. GW247-3R2A]PMY71919.1 hypothetical protein C1X26_15410 [Pseudomonas sp. MPR-R3A]PMY98860.1 hypothetical protein C1X24_07240 [Pseudomonas sp. FW305-124]PNA94168.1 hypothetical protein C1X23_09480 [Pseudomonas sp. FW300-E2]PNB03073.1 hypothetical protein C1X27_10750 [Pseudomonas sp. MPR-AND1B]
MPYDTLNPVPSTDPRDLYDNAAITDKYVNGYQPFVADRLGKQRRTWMGMEEDFNNAQEGRATQFDQFLAGSAFVWLGDYGAGITFTSRSQYLVRDGYAYRLADSTTLPYTTTGNWALEQTKFSLINSDDVLRQELSQAPGAGLVGFSEAQTYAAETVGAALKNAMRKNVRGFGAVGDGVTDDTAAVKAAIAAAGPYGLVVFDEAGEYLVKEVLVQQIGQQWVGQGGQRSARLKKGFNGDLVVMANQGAISDLTLNNNGTNYTGRGIFVPSGFSQTLFRVRSVQSKGPSLEFAQDAGGGCNVIIFEGDTIDQDVVGAIKIAGDTGPHPRMFSGIWLSGGILDIASPGAGNGCSMSNFYIKNIKTAGPAAGGTALMHFSNGRVASIADTTTLSGSDITLVGVAFSGPVVLANMQGLRAEACTFGAGISEDFVTCRFNSYSDQVKTFSPGWTQGSGSQPSIGNGSLTGKYLRQGFLVKLEISLTVGSTTTFGNSAGPWIFGLPIGGTQNSTQDFTAGQCFDASASTDFMVNGQIAAGEKAMTISRNGQGVRDSFPFAWAAGDTIKLSFCYMSI